MTADDAQVTPGAPPPAADRWRLWPVAVLFGACAGLGALLSPLVGWLWVALSNPPQAPLAPNGGVFLGEQALNQQSGVTLWFLVLGAGFGAAGGLVVGWVGQRFGWLSVMAVLVLCAVATVLTRYLGVHVFGPDPRSEVVGASVGDPIRLDVWRRSSLPHQMSGMPSILE